MNFNRENWKAARAHIKQGLVKGEATASLKFARLCSKFPFKQIAEWKAAITESYLRREKLILVFLCNFFENKFDT